MPTERRWDEADRALMVNAYHWAARNSCGPDNCPGAAECVYAEHLDWDAFGAGLDALTAAGWRREADVRAEVAEEIAQAIEQAADDHNAKIADIAGVPNRGRDGMQSFGIRQAAAIARAHRTTPPTDRTEEHHDA